MAINDSKGVIAVSLAAVAFLLSAAPATAEAPEFLLRMSEKGSQPGSGAGELNAVRSMAGSSATGHVYLSESLNARVAEYTSWGLFVKAWGWDVAPEGMPGDTAADQLEICGPATPTAVPPPGLCRQGVSGDGKGQMGPFLAGGTAVDADGNVWIGDLEQLRIQKFSPAGDFLLTLGGDVNKTKIEEGAPIDQRNVCPIVPTDVCQEGTAGNGPSQLTHNGNTFEDHMAYNSALDAIVVGDKDRIQVFDLDGGYREEFPFEGALAALDEKTVTGLDVDPAGNIYFTSGGTPDVFKLSPSGAPLAPGQPGASSFDVPQPSAVAVDADGAVYVVDGTVSLATRVVKFAADGTKVVPTKGELDSGQLFPYVPPGGAPLSGLATNLCPGSDDPGNLYVASFRLFQVAKVDAYGTPPIGCEDPPPKPPAISAQYAVAVGTDDATLRAQINPKFLADTTYWLQYGTGKCSEGFCDKEQPLPPGLTLTDRVVNSLIPTGGIHLDGLAPDTTYHFRFIAQSSGGGPVYGIDPDGDEEVEAASPEQGLEGEFHTFKAPGGRPPCGNDSVRSGAGARLPDCRAYELVSPLDKGNADIGLVPQRRFNEMNQAAPQGSRFTYSALTAFGEPEGAAFVAQYLANREPDGWASKALSSPRTKPAIGTIGSLNNEVKAFSSDLCASWLRHNSIAALTPDAVPGYPNLYRRDNCQGLPDYRAITTIEPPNRSAEDYFELMLKGASEDGTHAVYAADDALHPQAPALSPKELLLYEHSDGETRFVCYLPNGNPSPKACSTGTLAGTSGIDKSSLHNAISADGSRIFWTAYSGANDSKDAHPGALYARIEGALTVAISTLVSASPVFFWTAADDGSKVIFEVIEGDLKGNLYEVDVDKALANEAGAARLIAEGVEGPLGASEDASHIYFSSTRALAPGATIGAHNLYHYEASGGGTGTLTFVMSLAAEDIGTLEILASAVPRPIHRLPGARGASVSPNGRYATFMSAASPTPGGYENLDAVTGEPTYEVYRYDAVLDQLNCISCNPSGARPNGADTAGSQVAARLQGWELNFHAPHVITDDGDRVFFESRDPLVPRDTNGTWDVYQWEKPGSSSCIQSNSSFGEDAGGCVDLISSGTSPADSTFLDATPSGDDIFIATQSSLVGADYGLNDVYDARVGGGFEEDGPAEECEGEACSSTALPPPAPTPPSTNEKPGNPRRAKPCRRSQRSVARRGKRRCVKKRANGARARQRARNGR